MNEALNNPVTRRRRETHSEEFAIGQKSDIDLSLDQEIIHGEDLPNIAGDLGHEKALAAALAFNEEPVTLLIEESSGTSETPETYVEVSVNGRKAEVLMDGKWVPVGWLPLGVEFTTKRKFVEILARAKPDSIKTMHDDATVEKPQNKVRRSTRAAYPMSIIEDRNPAGREWLSRIRMGH